MASYLSDFKTTLVHKSVKNRVKSAPKNAVIITIFGLSVE